MSCIRDILHFPSRNRRPYDRLELDNNKSAQIRLLRLAPGRGTIRITLSAHNVDELPSYEALSYVWGRDMCRTPVRVNGYKLDITQNLQDALNCLRDRKTHRVMWIDAICIDQENVDERNHQVQLMKLIYSKAHRVVVFLGYPRYDPDDYSWFVFQNMARVDRATVNGPKFVFGFDLLLRRDWFHRVWVVQEVVLAADAIIQVGNNQVSFSTFVQAVEDMLNKLNHQLYANNQSVLSVPWCDELANWITMTNETTATSADLRRRAVLGFLGSLRDRCLEVNNLKNFRAGNYGEHFAALYYWTWKRHATDPRDKVFSLLGMYEHSGEESTSSMPCQLVADYTKSTGSVFAEAMAVIITDGFQFGYPVLPLRATGVESVQDLPSWVPDLSFRKIAEEEYGVITPSRALIRPDDPRPIQPASDTIMSAISDSNKIHEKNTFSDSFHALHAQGMHMGVVTASCVLKMTSRNYQSPDSCRKVLMGLLREFFSGKNVSKRTILMALMGSVSGSKEVEYLTVDKALPLFETMYERNDVLFFETNEEPPSNNERMIELMWDALGCCAQGRTIFVTDTGHVGISTGELKEGDLLVGLFGIMFPFILRKASADTYTMVNVAHVAEHKLGHVCDCDLPAEGKNEEDTASCGHRVFTIV